MGFSRLCAAWAFRVCKAFLLAATTLSAAQPAANRLRIETQWKTQLGPYDREGLFRLAPCPDGSSYFTDARGRIAHLTVSGAVAFDSGPYEELKATVAVACDSEGFLHALNPGLLTKWEARNGKPHLISSIDVRSLRLSPSRLAVAGDGNFYVLSVRSKPGFAAYLHQLDQRGNFVAAFESPPVATDAVLAQTAIRRGSIALDQQSGRVAFLPLNPFEVGLFDQRGRETHRRVVASGFQPLRTHPEHGYVIGGDQVMSAAFVAGVGLVSQTAETVRLDSGKGSGAFFLNVIDPESLDLRDRLSLKGVVGGVLQGASADGGLYFLTVTPRIGVQVTRAALAR
jgi:hypothetical protein